MGDFNIDLANCSNRKWNNLIQLFDFKQLVTNPTRVTKNSSTIIDYIYCTNPENITDHFVSHDSISDHFPICFRRKINSKIKKSTHTTTSYRCFKNFNEEEFLSDPALGFNSFSLSPAKIDSDITWYDQLLKHLDKHAPVKFKRVKTNHLPKWFTTEILQARRQRDFNKRKRNWVEYKRYRNMTKSLIRKAKQKHFSDTVTDHRDAKTIWQHIHSVKNKDAGSLNRLPDELNIDDKIITNSHEIASQLANALIIQKVRQYLTTS